MSGAPGPVRGRGVARVVTALGASLLLAWSAGARSAAARPAIVPAMPGVDVRVGTVTSIGGSVNEGGSSAALALLWPAARGVDAGVELSVDDFGSSIEQLHDPNTGQDLGTVIDAHRSALGAAWRLDGRMPTWRGLQPVATATWGLWRIRDDHLGNTTRSSTAAGLSAGAGVRRPFGGVSLGLSAAWHRAFSPQSSHWLVVGVDFGWH